MAKTTITQTGHACGKRMHEGTYDAIRCPRPAAISTGNTWLCKVHFAAFEARRKRNAEADARIEADSIREKVARAQVERLAALGIPATVHWGYRTGYGAALTPEAVDILIQRLTPEAK